MHASDPFPHILASTWPFRFAHSGVEIYENPSKVYTVCHDEDQCSSTVQIYSIDDHLNYLG